MTQEDKNAIVWGFIFGTILGIVICLILQFTGYPYNS